MFLGRLETALHAHPVSDVHGDMDQTCLIQRAWRAYQKTEGVRAEQPSVAHSEVCHINGRDYVALRSERKTLAVYRVRHDTGALRRLRVWPLELMGSDSKSSTQLKRHSNRMDTLTHA